MARLRTGNALTRWPSIASAAGSTVSEVTIAMKTALIPPNAIECRNTSGKTSMLASDSVTVRPEMTTVRPAVRMVCRAASCGESPRRSCSR